MFPEAPQKRELTTSGRTCGQCRGGNVQVTPESQGWTVCPWDETKWIVPGGGLYSFGNMPALLLRPCKCQEAHGQEGGEPVAGSDQESPDQGSGR